MVSFPYYAHTTPIRNPYRYGDLIALWFIGHAWQNACERIRPSRIDRTYGVNIPSLKNKQPKPLKIGRAPKGNDRIPTIHFSGAILFAIREGKFLVFNFEYTSSGSSISPSKKPSIWDLLSSYWAPGSRFGPNFGPWIVLKTSH